MKNQKIKNKNESRPTEKISFYIQYASLALPPISVGGADGGRGGPPICCPAAKLKWNFFLNDFKMKFKCFF